MGHVRDLPERKLGLDVDERLRARPTRSCRRKKDTITELKREAAKADMVYLATDPDREGEAIAWHLQEALGLPDERVRRVMFHEITERAVKEAFQPRRPDQHGQGQRPAGAAVPRPVRRLPAQPAALEEGRPAPERRAGPVGRRPPDRRPREGDPGVRLRGILEDHRDARAPPARPPRPTASRPRSPSGRGRSSRPRTRPTPAPSATPWPRPPTRSRRSRRSRSSTRPTPRSRRARSSSRRRSASGSRASGR